MTVSSNTPKRGRVLSAGAVMIAVGLFVESCGLSGSQTSHAASPKSAKSLALKPLNQDPRLTTITGHGHDVAIQMYAEEP